MTLPADLVDLVPEVTRRAWPIVAEAAPSDGVLMGGTALTVHLRHRTSRDLDVFALEKFDPTVIEAALRDRAEVAVVSVGDGTLNCVVGEAKVQFLWARGQTMIDAPSEVAGMAVGSLRDIAATKLKVIGDRGELRDYFDLMEIERQRGLLVEEIVPLYLLRYGLPPEHTSLWSILRALGHFDDVEDDPFLEADRGGDVFEVVRRYWQRRQSEVIDAFDRDARR